MAVPIEELFHRERVLPSRLRVLLPLLLPLGIVLLFFRVFLALHTFVVACLLRKSASSRLRSLVLRVMMALLGIVVRSEGTREQRARMLVGNHVTALDHLAVDLIQPCLFPSVWDIPEVLRWCFGYSDLGAHSGRPELIRQARAHLADADRLPLLAFPEGAMTNGKRGLLRFSTWPMDASSLIQPLSIRVARPLVALAPSVLGGTWWQDCVYFLFAPITVITVRWLPCVEQEDGEAVEAFSKRTAQVIAADLGVETTSFNGQDVVEAAKRHRREQMQRGREQPARSGGGAGGGGAAGGGQKKKVDARRLDELAMRIKQSFPAVRLNDIRADLDKGGDHTATIERIKSGGLRSSSSNSLKQLSNDPTSWRRHFEERRWDMIEANRSKYMENLIASGDA